MAGRVTPCALFPVAATTVRAERRILPLPGTSAIVIAYYLATLLLFAGCCSVPPLPPADLSAAGWRVQQGQAVWKPTSARPELAGEILFATNSTGDCFVQFTKSPFTLATAQIMNGSWQIEFGGGKHSWRGRGEPPSRFVWFQLPRAFSKQDVGGSWSLERVMTNSWRLKNRRTGESLEGQLIP